MTPRSRRVLAAASAAALLGLGASAAPASAAAVNVTLGCIVFVNDYSAPAIPVVGAGFTPYGSVTLLTSSDANPAPRLLGSTPTDGHGNFLTITGAAVFASKQTRHERFKLIASDGTSSQIFAINEFRQVRLGYNRVPASGSPSRRVKHIARGFTPGATIYAHFRYHGKTRVTKRLGKARGPCGIVTRKMRALPVKRARLGLWKVYVDEHKRFSLDSRPQVRSTFKIELKRN